MKKITFDSIRNQKSRRGSISLSTLFHQYCEHPNRSYLLSVHDRTLQVQHQEEIGYCTKGRKANSGQSKKQDNRLFMNVLSKLDSSNKSGRSSRKGEENWPHHQNDPELWEGSNQPISQASYNISKVGSKSPLRRVPQSHNCEQNNRHAKTQMKFNFSSYNIINRVYQKNPYTSAFTHKTDREIQQNPIRQASIGKQSSELLPEPTANICQFKKISSQIRQPSKLLDLSFQNCDNFINAFEEKPQPPISNEIQVQDLQRIIEANIKVIQEEKQLKYSPKEKRSLIQQLGSVNNNNSFHKQLACQESLVKVPSKASQSRRVEDKGVIEERMQEIVNPYAKSGEENQKKLRTEPDKQIEKEKKPADNFKLTDEQVCKIISSRKKVITSSKNNINQGRESQKFDVNALLDISDLDVNALLKIESNSAVKQSPTHYEASPYTSPNLQVPTTKPLESSFVPHYYLNRCPQSQMISDTNGYSLFVPSNINSTKPASSQVYQNRRLSEQSEQPSSLVFELSANSNF